MKIHVILNGNSLEVDEISEITPAFEGIFRAWVNAQQPGSAAEALDGATEHLKKSNDAAEQMVKDNTGGTNA